MERRSILIIGGAVFIAVALFVGWNLGPGRRVDSTSNLTEVTDVSTIQSTVELSRLSILTSETYAGNIRIRNITGLLKNISPMPIRRIDLKMTFTDNQGKTVQESTHTAFSPRRKPLDPGAQYRFEVNFENLPRTWNYRVPMTQIVRIGY